MLGLNGLVIQILEGAIPGRPHRARERLAGRAAYALRAVAQPQQVLYRELVRDPARRIKVPPGQPLGVELHATVHSRTERFEMHGKLAPRARFPRDVVRIEATR